MRRADREVTDVDGMIDIIDHCKVCHIAMTDGKWPYIVAMNFAYSYENGQLVIYLHSAKEGKKLDLLKKDNRVTFEMDCGHNFILYEERMSCTMGYESVIGHGTVEFLPEEEKLDGLKILMRHYHAEDFKFNTKPVKVTTVMRMTILDMTGKRRNNIH